MSTLATVNLSPNSPANSSSAGPIILQGPHHSAQKSTSTGPVLLASITSVAKLWSVTGLVFVLIGVSVKVSRKVVVPGRLVKRYGNAQVRGGRAGERAAIRPLPPASRSARILPAGPEKCSAAPRGSLPSGGDT